MLYPIAIEPGDDVHAFGVVVPDIPGCFSAGDTLDEAIANAREAIELHLEGVAEDDADIPVAGTVAQHQAKSAFAGLDLGGCRRRCDALHGQGGEDQHHLASLVDQAHRRFRRPPPGVPQPQRFPRAERTGPDHALGLNAGLRRGAGRRARKLKQSPIDAPHRAGSGLQHLITACKEQT